MGPHDSLPSELSLAWTNNTILAFTALFSGDPSKTGSKAIHFGTGSAALQVVQDQDNPLGCSGYERSSIPPKSVVLVNRGDCTFVQKLDEASLAGAAGVIVINTDDSALNPSSEPEDTAVWDGTLNDVALVVVRKSDGDLISDLLDALGKGDGRLTVRVEPTDDPEEEKVPAGKRRSSILVVNGHAIMNAIVDG
jgi:mannosidase alpha-like ER degradation enhancer 1